MTWTIEEKGENCSVTLTHEGLEAFADGGETFAPQNYQMGWNAFLKANLRNFLVGIERLKFEIEIQAPSTKIWNVMWDTESYKIWTAPFCEGSYYKGELKQGSRVQFLNSEGSGMYSDVFFYKENINVVFSHIGEVKDNKEMEVDETTKQWTGCMEMYHLIELENGNHKLTAEVDCTKEHITYMREKFPLGLQKIKELSEN